MKQDKSCGAVIINNEQKYLVVGKENFVIGKDSFWGFPKGHVEGEESEQETALREIKEETDLDVKFIPGFKEAIRYKINEEAITEKEVVYFLARPLGDKVTISDELDEYKWLKFEEAYTILSRENLKEVLRKAHEFLGS